MNPLLQLAAGTLGALVNLYIGYLIGRNLSRDRIDRLQRTIQRLENPKVDQAPKFRVRTAESDPNRQATVRSARVRAIRYKLPPPRR